MHLHHGISPHNFQYFRLLYTSSRLADGITLGPVVAETAEDETATIRRLCYNGKDDTLRNACSLSTNSHQCTSTVTVLNVGAEENG